MNTNADRYRAAVDSLTHAIAGDGGPAAIRRAIGETCTSAGAAIAARAADDYAADRIDRAELQRRCACAAAAPYPELASA